MLQCDRDPHNVVDRYSVTVKKGVVVGLYHEKYYQDSARSSYGMGYNRLLGNWGEKTLSRSTPRQPGRSLFLLTVLAVVSLDSLKKNNCEISIHCWKFFVRLIFVCQQPV